MDNGNLIVTFFRNAHKVLLFQKARQSRSLYQWFAFVKCIEGFLFVFCVTVLIFHGYLLF